MSVFALQAASNPNHANLFDFNDACTNQAAQASDNAFLKCLWAAPNSRGQTLGDGVFPVFFRPEVKSITGIDDKTSEFSVKVELFTYWYDAAVDADPNLLGDADILWSPRYLFPDEMLEYVVLIEGESRFMPEETASKKYGPKAINLINMARRSIVRYRMANTGQWDMTDFPFDSRVVSWHWHNQEPWARRKVNVEIEPLEPVTFDGNVTLLAYYNRAVQTNDMTGIVPSSFAPNGDMKLTPLTVCTVDGWMEAPDIGLLQEIPVSRVSKYVIASYVVPVTLCTLVGMFGQLIPITVAMPRFAASIISMLTVATVKRGLDSSLPPSGQESLLVFWLVIQMIILGTCSVITGLGFFLRAMGSDGPELQHYADSCYNKAIVLLWIISVPLTYLAVECGGYGLLVIVGSCVCICLAPSICLYMKTREYKELRDRWNSVTKMMALSKSLKNAQMDPDKSTTIQLDLDQEPMIRHPMKLEAAPYSSQDPPIGIDVQNLSSSNNTSIDHATLRNQVDDWFEKNGPRAFERYDLDNSGTINSIEELSQLAVYIYTKIQVVCQPPCCLEQLLEHVELQLEEHLEMSFNEFQAWFVNVVSTLPTSPMAMPSP